MKIVWIVLGVFVWFFLGLGACADDRAEPQEEQSLGPACDVLSDRCEMGGGSSACGGLFGRPNTSTGLPENVCAPQCSCGGALWEPPSLDEDTLAPLRSMRLLNSPENLQEDPYSQPAPPPVDLTRVCGVLIDAVDRTAYTLETFASSEEARDVGATVTHFGPCGLCSSLQDLAVYIAIPDLTQPVRECGLLGFVQGPEAQQECIQELGFTTPCAQIWSYNTSHTGSVCRDTCISLLSAPYHTEDGAPNDCIQCDEDQSGPVFKAVAGRTRRNSGLPTALCRPCGDVRRVDHNYALP